MKRNDIILVIAVLVIAIGAMVYLNVTKTDGDQIIVTIDGQVYKTLDLNKDTTMKIESGVGEYNLLVIKDGYASVEDASCPDLICVHAKDIHFNGEKIVCLPNKVVIVVESNETSGIDGVVN